MNTEAYISSGILELYVLGDLTQEERAEVEKRALENAAIQEALGQIERDIQSLDQVLADEVSGEVKNSLFERIDQLEQGEQQNSAPSTNQPERKQPNWLMAASVSLMILASAAAIYFYQQWQSSENDYQQLASQNEMLADNIQQTKRSLDQVESELAIITSAQTIEVPLDGLPLQPEAQAYVYFQPENQEVYLKVARLLDPGQINDYQLWAIVDGKPIDIGLIDLNKASLLQKMKSVTNASAFAVTLEPKGGSKEPTLDQMVVLGEVKV